MAVERIFYVTASELSVMHCSHGSVLPLARFDLNDEGVQEFSAYIKQDADHPSALLVDVIEEEFRIESAPHVMGRDRHQLLDRKAATLFRGLNYRSAQVIGRETSGRRDDQVLFSAINKPEVLDRWLKAISVAKVPLTGVYSVAMLGAFVINKYKIRHDNTLILTIQNGRLLRQSFFCNGKLKLSRLTPLSGVDSSDIVNGLINEVDRMKRYLGRLQLINFKQSMEVYLLSGGEQLQYFRQGCRNDVQLNYHFFDLMKLSSDVKLKIVPNANECERYFSYILSKILPDVNYVQSGNLRYYLQYRMRRWMVAMSIALASASALWSVSDIHAGQNLAFNADLIAAESLQMKNEYKLQMEKMPSVQYPPRIMRAAVEASQKLAEHKPRSLEALMTIGDSLALQPNIELDQLRWGPLHDLNLPDNSDNPAVTAEVDMVTIKAHLKQFPANYQAAFTQVDALVGSLKNSPQVAAVKIIGFPLDTDPESLLIGETRYNGEDPVARFELEVQLKSRDHEI